MELLVIPIFLILGYFVYRSIKGEVEQRMDHFATAATELGGSFEAPESLTVGTPKLSYRSGTIEVYVGERTMRQDQGAMGGEQQLYTTYTVGFPAIGPDMVIKKSNVAKTVKKKLGRQADVEIGDEAFDDAFVIDVADDDAPAVRALLTAPRREAIQEVFDRFGTTTVTSIAIVTEKIGTVNSSQELVANIRHLVGVAQVLTKPKV